MGIYLNPGNESFHETRNSDIYVDKSEMISILNRKIKTKGKYVCISRPRRFGKSVDAEMLVAYYGKGCDSHVLFDDLKISKCETYETHLNKHNVIHIDVQEFLSKCDNVSEIKQMIQEKIICELKEVYEIKTNSRFLDEVLMEVYYKNDVGFIFIIDEWDCVFRHKHISKDDQEAYLDFLRLLFKGKVYIDLVYMTGILPIKKYGTHSALNMFDEISVLQSEPYQKFMGFHEDEVKALCEKYEMDFNEMKLWYDGYEIGSEALYCPRSVVQAIEKRKYYCYWTQTETFDALKTYIDLNVDGLKDDVIRMLSDECVNVNIIGFQNDMSSYASTDDIFTLLIYLGYLTYNEEDKTVKIPNKEVKDEFATVIRKSDWGATTKTLRNKHLTI